MKGKGRTGVGNDDWTRCCDLEMRKKLEKELQALTGVVVEGKGWF